MIRTKKLYLVLAGLTAIAVGAQANIISSHVDNNDPGTEGFAVVESPAGTASNGSPINDGGTLAWSLDTGVAPEELHYERTLTAQEITDAQTLGYTIRANVRIPTANKALSSDGMVWTQVGDDWWLMRWKTDSSSNPTVVIHGHPTEQFVPDPGYHLYELVVDAGGVNANLFVDSILSISNISPQNNPGGRFLFGDLDSGNPGTVINYNLVQFEIAPEPDTLAMLIAGLGVLSFARRFRR
jgi:hypothetical protein